LKRILIDGGYIEGGVYYYYLNDHQGNTRLVCNASGTVIQKNHYYPFGMTYAETPVAEQGKQPYKYNGKELDQMNGLNQYDYSARYYDPAIARFTTMDPMAEKYYSVSPYAYCNNNPVNLVDPTGMIWDEASIAAVNGLKESLKNRITSLEEYKVRIQNSLNSNDLNDSEIEKYSNELTAVNDMTSNVQTSLKDVDRLGDDQKHTYVLTSNKSGENGYVQKGTNGKINIVSNGEDLTVHEITHVRQSLDAGKLNFDLKNNKLQYTSPNVAVQANEEAEAYQKQYSVKRSDNIGGIFFKYPSEITPQRVGYMKRANGTLAYPAIYKYFNN